MTEGGTERTGQKHKNRSLPKAEAGFSLTGLPACKTEVSVQQKRKSKNQSPRCNISDIHYSVKVNVKGREVCM